jgi:hypothetical protein
MLRFAIIGSAEPERNDPNHKFPFKPPVDIAKANAAAKALGGALAKKGHGLIVYDANYIEAVVVGAYVAANPPVPDRGAPIVVRQPPAATNAVFAEERTHPALFDRLADSSGQWEVSFYRSLADADGLMLIGGANSTLIAGQVAIGAKIPVLALLRTGGAADTVWRTIAPGVDLPTGNEHARMADDPGEDAAKLWVEVLEGQDGRRNAVETGPIVWHAVGASVLFVLALAAAFGGQLGADSLPASARPAVTKALLFGATLLAGVAGAAVRMVFERRYGRGPRVPPSMAITAALGLMAGALAGMLYLVAQPGDLEITANTAGLRLVSLVLMVATVGGLTAEAVFRKLLGIDVLRTGGLSTSGDRGS